MWQGSLGDNPGIGRTILMHHILQIPDEKQLHMAIQETDL